jgi:Icc-related predicted phosphoesterase
MKIFVASDFHFEYYNTFQEIEKAIDSLPRADVICLCGDIICLFEYDLPVDMVESNRNKFVFETFSKKYKHVIYVRGNHEYWAGSYTPTKRSYKLPSNVYELLNEKITIDGQDFVGSSMFYPKTPESEMKSVTFSDFTESKSLKYWIWSENRIAKNFLNNNVDNKSIVITHHLPSRKSVHPRFESSPLNCFFVCDWAEDLIIKKQPKYWLHGHTHNNCDYNIGVTEVICNPLGYDFDPNPGFTRSSILEI